MLGSRGSAHTIVCIVGAQSIRIYLESKGRVGVIKGDTVLETPLKTKQTNRQKQGDLMYPFILLNKAMPCTGGDSSLTTTMVVCGENSGASRGETGDINTGSIKNF